MSYRSTADLLTVALDRIARAFNRVEATRAVVLDIAKVFDRVWNAGFLYKLISYRISGRIFELISSFLSNRWLRVVLDGSGLWQQLHLVPKFVSNLRDNVDWGRNALLVSKWEIFNLLRLTGLVTLVLLM